MDRSIDRYILRWVGQNVFKCRGSSHIQEAVLSNGNAEINQMHSLQQKVLLWLLGMYESRSTPMFLTSGSVLIAWWIAPTQLLSLAALSPLTTISFNAAQFPAGQRNAAKTDVGNLRKQRALVPMKKEHGIWPIILCKIHQKSSKKL